MSEYLPDIVYEAIARMVRNRFKSAHVVNPDERFRVDFFNELELYFNPDGDVVEIVEVEPPVKKVYWKRPEGE